MVSENGGVSKALVQSAAIVGAGALIALACLVIGFLGWIAP